jgi:hypothetical protein
MARTACLVCLISTVNGCSKKRSLGRLAIVAGMQLTLSNLFFSFDIYGQTTLMFDAEITHKYQMLQNM